ncbi:MAG: hypothetical protein ACREJ2_09110 [Planctomycetota bacterium]
MRRHLIVYALLFLVLSCIDLVSTRLCMAVRMSREANEILPQSLGAMIASEIAFGTVGCLSLTAALRWKGNLDVNPGEKRTLWRLIARLNRSPRAPIPFICLLIAGLILWIKLIGGVNNLLLLTTGSGLYDRARALTPGISSPHFYWLFTIVTDTIFLVGMIVGLVAHWIRTGSLWGRVQEAQR